MDDNFAFLKDIDLTYFSICADIEKNARVRPLYAAKSVRTLLESIVINELQRYRLAKEDQLFKNLRNLKQADPTFYNRLGRVEYEVVKGNGRPSRTQNASMYFLKDVGNAASHVHSSDDFYARLSYETIAKALKAFHQFFRLRYADDHVVIKPFREESVPLEQYIIQDSYVPNDSKRSQCIREYRGIRKRGEYSKALFYSVIREYDPEGMDKLFLNRNIDAFSEVYSFAYPNGVGVRNINAVDEQYANFFIAYDFDRPVIGLEEFLKTHELSVKDRVSLCKQIADTIQLFHLADNPIYHRMLSYESILVSDYTDREVGYRPYVFKFDFAKITGINDGTVYKQLSDAGALETVKLARYRAGSLSPEASWDKDDIYSLGVLFTDVLLNHVSSKEISEKTFQELEKAGVSDSLFT